MDWYRKTVEETFRHLNTSPRGLSEQEARRRLERYGTNALAAFGKRTPLQMFFGQFKDLMILILIGAAFVSGALGELRDAVAITVILVLNAVIGFVQEYRAERAMEALKGIAAGTARVMREGNTTLPVELLVPGDVVLVEAGDIVPADLRLFDTVQLRIDEAVLTGESVPVEKDAAFLPDNALPLGDRKNMAYRGTVVTHGRGAGIVVATGMRTEFGRIAALLQGAREDATPLQKRLAAFGRRLAVAVLCISALVFLLGVLRGADPLHVFLVGVSLAVAAVPEALPAVVTISLALGARKMVERNALVRKLAAVETLGSVTYICSDKTGTLTLNRMRVEKIWVPDGGEEAEHQLLTAMALNNNVLIAENGAPVGDPTEVALYAAAGERGQVREELEKSFPRQAEIPFDSERKCMTTIHRLPAGGFISYTKGAAEAILARTAGVYGGKVAHEPGRLKEIEKIGEGMARDGLRVLAYGLRYWERLPDALDAAAVESELIFLGFVGLMDPPRPEAAAAIALCRSAGIRPVMVTGDHPLTAAAVARRVGLLEGQGELITGAELEELSESDFLARVENIQVYARVAPEQKLRIVRALQAKGHFVAMTGDGVNDAPALKSADIGVAMGRAGTDVAREASDLILLDDNFATIVRAVQEGRRIFDNIRKFIKYTMTSNSGEIWTIFLAPLLGLPIPLLPVHILWINLVTDGIPGLALAAEPEERDVMKRPPRHPQESIFAHGLGAHVIWVGLLMGAVSIFTQLWAIAADRAAWQTMVFTVLTLSQIGHVFAIRSERESLFTHGLLSNKPLLGAAVLTFLLQMGAIYVPFLNRVFHTRPLNPAELTVCLGLSAIVFVAVELEKLFKRRWATGRQNFR